MIAFFLSCFRCPTGAHLQRTSPAAQHPQSIARGRAVRWSRSWAVFTPTQVLEYFQLPVMIPGLASAVSGHVQPTQKMVFHIWEEHYRQALRECHLNKTHCTDFSFFIGRRGPTHGYTICITVYKPSI